MDSLGAFDALPRETAAAIQANAHGQALGGLLVIPPQEYPVVRSGRLLHLPFLWRMTPKRTLAFGERDLICVSVDSRGAASIHTIPLKSIISLEIATVLLYAWAQFTWTARGQVETLKIEFNAVGEHILRRRLETIRGLTFAPHNDLIMPDSDIEAGVAAMPLKFRNYLHYALLKGETLRAGLFQPAFRRGAGRMRPYLAPSRAIGLTDRSVVLVEEDVAGHKTYGVITRYFPLEKIAGVRFEADDHCVWLSMAIGEGGAMQNVRLPVQTSRAPVLEAALAPLAEPGMVAMTA